MDVDYNKIIKKKWLCSISTRRVLLIAPILPVCIVPSDVFKPKEHSPEELDAMLVPNDKRDSCKDYYVEFKKCILT